MTQPVQTIDVLLAEHAELELALADPALHSNPAEARRVGRRFARLAPIVATHRKLTSARDDSRPRASWWLPTSRSPPRLPHWRLGWANWMPNSLTFGTA